MAAPDHRLDRQQSAARQSAFHGAAALRSQCQETQRVRNVANSGLAAAIASLKSPAGSRTWLSAIAAGGARVHATLAAAAHVSAAHAAAKTEAETDADTDAFHHSAGWNCIRRPTTPFDAHFLRPRFPLLPRCRDLAHPLSVY